MASPFDLSYTVLVGGGLLVPCSIIGSSVQNKSANDYYNVWPGRVVSVCVFSLTKTEYMKAWRSLTPV